jgi:hypothetical protein
MRTALVPPPTCVSHGVLGVYAGDALLLRLAYQVSAESSASR